MNVYDTTVHKQMHPISLIINLGMKVSRKNLIMNDKMNALNHKLFMHQLSVRICNKKKLYFTLAEDTEFNLKS